MWSLMQFLIATVRMRLSQWPSRLALSIFVLCLLWWHSTDIMLFALVGLLNVLWLSVSLVFLGVFSGPASEEDLGVQQGQENVATQGTGLQSSQDAVERQEHADLNVDARKVAGVRSGSEPIISTMKSGDDSVGSPTNSEDASTSHRTDQGDVAEAVTAPSPMTTEELKEFYKSHPSRTVMIRVSEPAEKDREELLADIDVPDEGGNTVFVGAHQDEPFATVYNCHCAVPRRWSNEDLSARIIPIAQAALEVEQHLTIMMDGQSGTGKSWTMFDGAHNLISCVAEQVFAHTKDLRRMRRKATVSIMALEFYRDSFYDLLASSQNPRLHEPVRKSHGRWKFSSQECFTSDEVQIVVRQALRKRHLTPTDKNERSSRGHTVIIITVSMENSSSIAENVEVDMVFLDLAGSERQPKDRYEPEQLEDAKSIASTRLIFHSMLSPDRPYVNPRDSDVIRSHPLPEISTR